MTRTLPHAVESERALLGAVLQMPRLADDAAELEPEHMHDPRNQHVWRAVRELTARSLPIDAVTVGQQLADAGKLDASKAVTLESLSTAGVITRMGVGIRVLGQSELKAKISLEAHHASKTAVAAIEKLGGSVKVLKPTAEEIDAANKKKNTKSAASK